MTEKIIQYRNTISDIEAVIRRAEKDRASGKGNLLGPLEFRTPCAHPSCNLILVDILPSKRKVVGISIQGKIYCLKHALEHARSSKPSLTIEQFEGHLAPYSREGVEHIYLYDPGSNGIQP